MCVCVRVSVYVCKYVCTVLSQHTRKKKLGRHGHGDCEHSEQHTAHLSLVTGGRAQQDRGYSHLQLGVSTETPAWTPPPPPRLLASSPPPIRSFSSPCVLLSFRLSIHLSPVHLPVCRPARHALAMLSPAPLQLGLQLGYEWLGAGRGGRWEEWGGTRCWQPGAIFFLQGFVTHPGDNEKSRLPPWFSLFSFPLTSLPFHPSTLRPSICLPSSHLPAGGLLVVGKALWGR